MSKSGIFVTGGLFAALCTAIAVPLFALPVLAQSKAPLPPLPPKPPAFESMDANKDGTLTREEFEAFALKGCAPLPPQDRSAKGRRALPDDEAKGPQALDSDKDGRISWVEFSAPLKARFEAVDANKNGFIDSDERPKGQADAPHDHVGHKWREGPPHGPCAPAEEPSPVKK